LDGHTLRFVIMLPLGFSGQDGVAFFLSQETYILLMNHTI